MLVSVTIMLLVVGATLTTFKNGVEVNDAGSQLGDTNQNLRAGTNTLIRDLMMAGRIIANGGVPVPNGVGAVAIARPGPPGSALTFSFVADDDGTIMLPAITTGFQLGPMINASTTDIVTILTVDEFQPVLTSVPTGTLPTAQQAVIAVDGSQLTLSNATPWLIGDAVNDTQPLQKGDIILFKNANGMAMQTITGMDATHIFFAQNDAVNDWFHFNQRGTSLLGTIWCIKTTSACDTPPVTAAVQAMNFPTTALFRAMMITYYVDNTTTPGTPRLTRAVDHFTPQALAGVVEDMDLTYDLVDTSGDNVAGMTSLPVTVNGVTYTSNMIKKVNLHIGVRAEQISKPTQTYVRNHISTAVGVRSLASVDRYDTTP